MDSGNNSGGSMQSSSGGDEEYESRVGSISPFFNNPSPHFGSTSNHPIPTSILHHHHQSNLFDPQSQNLSSFSHSPTNPNPNPNALYNLDLIWPRGPRSDPNHTQLGNPTTLPSSSSTSQAVLGPSQGPSSNSNHQLHVTKNSKKRTRASRRAPTTVLTTDMSNFRQMVQEFTGIPAAPFSSSPLFSRGRLDLFATAGSAMRSGPLEPVLYRAASVQNKVQPSAFLSSSSSFFNSTMVDSVTSATTTTTTNNNNNNNNNNNAFNPSNNNYQLPSDQTLVPKHPQSLTNFQNPIMTFQSLLQFPYPPPPVFGSKLSQGSPTIPPSIHDLGGLGHEHLNTTLKGYQTHGNPDSRPNNNGGDHQQQQQQVGAFEGQNGNSQHVVVGYNPEKGLLQNISSRGHEGTVDSFFVQR